MFGNQQTIVDDRGRRHFLRVTVAAAAMIPFAVAAGRAAAAPAGGLTAPGCEPSGDQPKKCNCLVRGTEILTDQGPVPIEQLRMGDLVLTESGLKPIKCVVSFSSNMQESKWSEDALPARIVRSAFDTDVPNRDLYLTGAHCVFVDGYLIPVDQLVNGSSIMRALPPGVDSVDYFHLQFEQHEVMYAQGLRVESLRSFVSSMQDDQLSTETVLEPYAPVMHHGGGRANLMALLRLHLSKWIDVRDPVQIVYDRLFARAQVLEGEARVVERGVVENLSPHADALL